MHIRKAQPADLSICADIFAQAYRTEELTAWLFPHRDEYFGDYRRQCSREIETQFYQPGFVVCVAQTEESDDTWEEFPQVVGYAIWKRHGDSEGAIKWKVDTVMNKINRLIQMIKTHVQDILTPDRSADQSRMKLLEATDLFESIAERWHLSNIAVLPTHQRRGIARQLTKWGLEIANKEKVPVTLEATMGAEPLYRQMEFRDYSYNCLSEEIDGPALIWEPEGMEGSFGTKFPPREALIGRGKGRQWKPLDAYPGEE